MTCVVAGKLRSVPRTLGLDAVAERARRMIVVQFRQPTGQLGKLAGLVMASRRSNRLRNRWAVGQLDMAPGLRVLELGCGPGLAVQYALEAGAGEVLALDHSIEMIHQAERRNRSAAQDGRVAFRLGGLEALRAEDGPLDAALLVNVVHFLPDRMQAFDVVADLLRPGGKLVIVYQPRLRTVSETELEEGADDLAAEMREIGFTDIACHRLQLSPNPALCVVGRMAARGTNALRTGTRRHPPARRPGRPALRLIQGGAAAE